MVTANLNVEIEEDIYKEAKKKAIDTNMLLKEYVEKSLEEFNKKN